MDYPIWNVPFLGGAMVIALIAIIHVFIAHFAVGAGIFNAFTESFSLRTHNGTLRQFLRDHSYFLILFSFIGGAITGVGIWFSIALVSPDATAALIHLFIWAWATEYAFFIVEIVAGYIYYFTWDRLAPRAHALVGWIFAFAAFMSLVIINAIISFMLSPNIGALDSAANPFRFDVVRGFFNPTAWPAMFLRTISALAIVALFVMVLANASRKYNPEQRDVIVRQAGKFLLPLILMIPCAGWFFYAVPEQARFYVQGGAIAMTLLLAFGLVASTLIGFYSYFVVIKKRPVTLETAVLLLAIALVATGSSEFVREGMRKPYLIWDHMYSNGLLAARAPEIQRSLTETNTSMLRFAPWAINPRDIQVYNQLNPLQTLPELSDAVFQGFDDRRLADLGDTEPARIIRGRWIYNAQCLRCHTVDGYNAIRPLVSNWTPATLDYTLQRLHEYKRFMPPFVGTPRDRGDLVSFLHHLEEK